jgi:hypothetical protein
MLSVPESENVADGMFPGPSVCVGSFSVLEEHIIIFIFGHCLTEHFVLDANGSSNVLRASSIAVNDIVGQADQKFTFS